MHVVRSLIKGAACNQIVHVGTIQIKRRSGKKRYRDGCNKTRWILTGLKRTGAGISLARGCWSRWCTGAVDSS